VAVLTFRRAATSWTRSSAALSGALRPSGVHPQVHLPGGKTDHPVQSPASRSRPIRQRFQGFENVILDIKDMSIHDAHALREMSEELEWAIAFSGIAAFAARFR
jgi:hypothetical protein